MRPEEFGPFLAEQRKKRALTQTELAEKLHISTAAVSKWERGKCLPEVAKLEDIARVLNVSVLEVMRCEVAREPVSAEEVKETYAQTANLSQAEHRKKLQGWLAAIGAVVLLLAAVLCSHYFPVWRIAKVWWPSYFTTGEISELVYIGSWEDRETAEQVLELAELAFSDLETPDGELEEKYGLLKRYATKSERGAVTEEHSLELWSAHFHSTDGTMWVYYSKEAYDAQGRTLCGSWKIPSLWYLEKNETGQWEVVAIKEHP